jgi:hypothetical protein
MEASAERDSHSQRRMRRSSPKRRPARESPECILFDRDETYIVLETIDIDRISYGPLLFRNPFALAIRIWSTMRADAARHVRRCRSADMK